MMKILFKSVKPVKSCLSDKKIFAGLLLGGCGFIEIMCSLYTESWSVVSFVNDVRVG